MNINTVLSNAKNAVKMQSSNSSNQSSGIGRTSSEAYNLTENFENVENESSLRVPTDPNQLKNTKSHKPTPMKLENTGGELKIPPALPKKNKNVNPNANSEIDQTENQVQDKSRPTIVKKSPEQFIGETNRKNKRFANVVNKKRSKYATQV